MSPFPANFPQTIGGAAYGKVSGYPTVCGGSHDGHGTDLCYSIGRTAFWFADGQLSVARSAMGFVELTPNQLFITGNGQELNALKRAEICSYF